MTHEVKRAAVIGAGVMGAAIAAHLANVGVPALLLDVPAEGEGRDARDRLARQGLERALKASPALFYDKADARLITTGNVDDDLERRRTPSSPPTPAASPSTPWRPGCRTTSSAISWSHTSSTRCAT